MYDEHAVSCAFSTIPICPFLIQRIFSFTCRDIYNYMYIHKHIYVQHSTNWLMAAMYMYSYTTHAVIKLSRKIDHYMNLRQVESGRQSSSVEGKVAQW